jgi:hypothetical protein
MDDPAKVVITLSLFGSVAYSISVIAKAAIAGRKGGSRLDTDAAPPLTEARLERIEQAVEAIALEVERISEGQRFTTRLLSEQSRPANKPLQPHVAANTPI